MEKLSGGAIAGIVIAVAIFLIALNNSEEIKGVYYVAKSFNNRSQTGGRRNRKKK